MGTLPEVRGRPSSAVALLRRVERSEVRDPRSESSVPSPLSVALDFSASDLGLWTVDCGLLNKTANPQSTSVQKIAIVIPAGSWYWEMAATPLFAATSVSSDMRHTLNAMDNINPNGTSNQRRQWLKR